MGDERVPARIVHNVRETVMSRLIARSREATICSSEVARALADGSADHGISQWRYLMPVAHAVVDELVADELIMLGWKVLNLAHRNGPYRIRRAGGKAERPFPSDAAND